MSRVGCLQDRRKPYLIDGIGGYDLYNYNKGQLQNSYFLRVLQNQNHRKGFVLVNLERLRNVK